MLAAITAGSHAASRGGVLSRQCRFLTAGASCLRTCKDHRHARRLTRSSTLLQTRVGRGRATGTIPSTSWAWRTSPPRCFAFHIMSFVLKAAVKKTGQQPPRETDHCRTTAHHLVRRFLPSSLLLIALPSTAEIQTQPCPLAVNPSLPLAPSSDQPHPHHQDDGADGGCAGTRRHAAVALA